MSGVARRAKTITKTEGLFSGKPTSYFILDDYDWGALNDT